MNSQDSRTDTDILFRELEIGPVTLRNRIVQPGMSLGYLTETGELGERYRQFLARRAAGGAAVIGIGSSPVHPSSYKRSMQPELWRNSVVDGLSAAAALVHDRGALLSIILWHGGRHITHRYGRPAMGPSQVASPDTSEVPKATTRNDIREITEGYGKAAAHCVQARIDVIEVQTASDYLLGSFLNPSINRRTDEYGGSPTNRRRFAMQVLEKVRETSGSSVAVGVRTSVEHLIPHDPEGYGEDESFENIAAFADAGLIDYVSLMTGSHYWFPGMISPAHVRNERLLEQAARFRKKLSIPVIVAGGIRTPGDASAVLANGQADAVGLARAHLADPDWANKVKAGHADRVRPCVACNQACIGFAIQRMPATCIVNPVTGREFELREEHGRAKPRRVAVVGGGPGGLEAARVAAERGHEVTLYEAGSSLGGAMRLAGSAPHRSLMGSPVAWWESELARLGVTVQLSHSVKGPAELEADHVIWATGAVGGHTQLGRIRPQLVDGIPGTAGAPHGREIIGNPGLATGTVLVIDEEGGWPAVSTAEALAVQSQVSSVTVATDRTALGLPDLFATLEIGEITKRIQAAGIVVHANTLISSVSDQTALTTTGEALGPFDSIVLCTGAVSNPVPDDVCAIGDCLAPRSIWAAVSEGMEAARSI